ncbi:MAG: hypothetical protein O3A00_18990 [Planctomycetota bacterium]|nr:hypothetical protein [Planctomycetota bacterium]
MSQSIYWQSETHNPQTRIPLKRRLRTHLARGLRPLREFLGKVVKHPELSNVDAAARFKAWQLEGDYLEFGVFTGRTFVEAYHSIKSEERNRNRKEWRTKFYAFDSFQGLPKPKGVDVYYEQYAEGAYAATEHLFRSNLVRHKVNLDDVVIVAGFYSELLKPERQEQFENVNAAIVMIDCDLYSSARDALNFLTDKLMDGAIIIFADWYVFRANPQLGQQRAFREWLDLNPQFKASQYFSIQGYFTRAFNCIASFPSTASESQHPISST